MSEKQMKILVLSDKKPGHYKQSLGIVQKIPDCRVEWVEIEYRAKWRDNLLRVFMCVFQGVPLSSGFIQKMFKWCLTTQTYNTLLKLQDTDVILSTGSSLGAINLLLSRTLHAKSVTCLRPSPIGIRHFDLAILPKLYWDKAKPSDNICQTIGVPNPISPELLDTDKASIMQSLNLQEGIYIGILIGGSDRHETITMDDAMHLHEICNTVISKLNAKVLITTSRRTPPEVNSYLKSSFENVEWCPLFVEPTTPSELEDPYQAILSLSELLIVSADSFSMVCEAASSGRKVSVLSLTQKRKKLPKRYSIYEYMEKQSIINQCKLTELDKQITRELNCQTLDNQLRDTEKVVIAIQHLIGKVEDKNETSYCN